jgi:acyl-CoA hydrolase
MKALPRVMTSFGSEARVAALLGSLPTLEPRVVISGNAAVPWRLLTIADATLERYRLFGINLPVGVPDRAGLVHETPFVGAGVRHSVRLQYLPARMSLVPQLLSGSHAPDVVLLHTSTPYRGAVSLGIEVNVLPAAIAAARRRGALVIAQLNPRMPFTYGDAVVPLDDIDLTVEVDEALDTAPHVGGNQELFSEIGARVARHVTDGTTLQVGIGAIPDAALAAIRHRHGLRIWSEMVSDGVVGLAEAGQLDPTRPIVCSFATGSERLYAWADHNPQLQMLRTETTNDPALVSRQPAMASINTALQVDLFGQANASRRPGAPGRVHSGFGGQTDFIVGAMHSPGGRSSRWPPYIHVPECRQSCRSSSR